jgi:hypothetical protein
VKKPQTIASPLDRALFAAITRRWDKGRVGNYFDNVQRHDSAIPPVVLNSLQSVDTKASGLLTHTSMMIAGLGLIALGCLRCLSIFQSKQLFSRTSNKRELVNRELILRRELYAWCNRMAIVVTILVFVGLPFLFFYKPGH